MRTVAFNNYNPPQRISAGVPSYETGIQGSESLPLSMMVPVVHHVDGVREVGIGTREDYEPGRTIIEVPNHSSIHRFYRKLMRHPHSDNGSRRLFTPHNLSDPTAPEHAHPRPAHGAPSLSLAVLVN